MREQAGTRTGNHQRHTHNTHTPTCSRRVPNAHSDHSLVCQSVKGVITSRHHLIVSAWRRIIGRAGVASTRKPTVAEHLQSDKSAGPAAPCMVMYSPCSRAASLSLTSPSSTLVLTPMCVPPPPLPVLPPSCGMTRRTPSTTAVAPPCAS